MVASRYAVNTSLRDRTREELHVRRWHFSIFEPMKEVDGYSSRQPGAEIGRE